MTFIVAFARPGFALIASDTRTTMRDVPDGPVTGYADDAVKLFDHGFGWFASGPSVSWREMLQAGVQPVDAMRQLEVENPAMARIVRERQLTFVVGVGPNGCYRRVFDWAGIDRWAEDDSSHLPVLLGPTGSDPAVVQRFINDYAREIRGELSQAALVNATRRLYGLVYEHCGPEGTVSPLVSIGFACADGRRQLIGPLPVLPSITEVAA